MNYLSVIVTTHFRPLLLERCLESIKLQNFDDYEIILCSDEGSFETKQVAANSLRPKDKFIVLPDAKGPADTRNAGLFYSNSKKIIFVDDDDAFDPGFFNAVFNKIDISHPICFTNYTRIFEDRDCKPPATHQTLKIFAGLLLGDEIWKGNVYPINTLIFATDVVKKIKFDSTLKSHEDWDFLLNLAALFDFKHLDMYGPIVYLTDSETRNSTTGKWEYIINDILKIFLKHPSRDPSVRKFRAEVLSRTGIVIPECFL